MSHHQGSCHCQKVRYEVEIDLSQIITCNCSICSRKGTILGFVPEAQFKLHEGRSELTDYTFNKKSIHHYFCKTCGVTSFAEGSTPDGAKMIAVNVRCLDNVVLDDLQPVAVDGKSF